MGLFGRIKDMFGGSGTSKPGGDAGIYMYVQLDRSSEVVQLRLEPQYELVPDYDTGGFQTNKTIVGPRSFERAAAIFMFDENRELVGADISGGELADEAAWNAQEAKPASTDPVDEDAAGE